MSGTPAAASYGDLLMTSLVVLGGVCIAAFLVVRLVGRFLATGRVRGAHLLDVVARVPLEPRRSLYVVEVAGKTLLVGTSEMGLSVLSELDASEVRARSVPRPTFGELVRSAWDRRSRRRAGEAAATDDANQHPAALATDRHTGDVHRSADAVDAGGVVERGSAPRDDLAGSIGASSRDEVP